MNDRIHLKDLTLPTVIGVPDEEREWPQSVSVSATMILEKPVSDCGDRLENTIDYYAVSQAMRKVAATGERRLIETLAEDLAAEVLSFPGIFEVIIEVEKFIIPNCGAVSIEIQRRSGSGDD